MLTLTRSTDDRIRIGPDVTVEVVSIKGNKVQLGITAPRSVKILREELLPATPDTPFDRALIAAEMASQA